MWGFVARWEGSWWGWWGCACQESNLNCQSFHTAKNSGRQFVCLELPLYSAGCRGLMVVFIKIVRLEGRNLIYRWPTEAIFPSASARGRKNCILVPISSAFVKGGIEEKHLLQDQGPGPLEIWAWARICLSTLSVWHSRKDPTAQLQAIAK